jgi:hypothetical protein
MIKNLLHSIKVITYINTDYFAKQESTTPQTTPSNKNTANGFSLKQINFSEYLDNKYNSVLPSNTSEKK